MYVCVCNSVTDSDIRNAVNEGVRSLKQLKRVTGCGSTCGSCRDEAGEVLKQALAENLEPRGFIPVIQTA